MHVLVRHGGVFLFTHFRKDVDVNIPQTAASGEAGQLRFLDKDTVLVPFLAAVKKYLTKGTERRKGLYNKQFEGGVHGKDAVAVRAALAVAELCVGHIALIVRIQRSKY